MKRFHASLALIVVCAGLGWLAGTARSQSGPSQPQQRDIPHRIGLIDMGYVFQKYEKAQVLREELKVEVESADARAGQFATRIQNLSRELKEKREGSPEYNEIERELFELNTQFEAFRRDVQRQLMRKESELFKTIYLEVSDMVAKYADHFGYTLVLRFDREGLENASQPQEIIQRLNRDVVFHRNGDDISEKIAGYLNEQYQRSSSGGPVRPPAGDVQRTSGPRGN